MTAPLRKALRIAPVVLALSIGAGLVAGCGSSSSASGPSTTSAPPVRQAAGVSQEERSSSERLLEAQLKRAEAIERQLAEAAKTFKDQRP